MAKIIRKTQYLFAENSPPNSVSAFGSIEAGSPNYSLDPAILQNEPEWGQGWTSTQYEGVRAPYFFDRNAVDLVAFYQLAYILQEGIAEWDAGTTYYTNSMVQYGGNIYKSLQDNNLGNTPPTNSSNAYWLNSFFSQSFTPPTRTVLTPSSGTGGSGTYTPPTGVVRIYVRMIGGGGGGAGWDYASDTSFGLANGTSGGATSLGSFSCGGGAGGTASHQPVSGSSGGTPGASFLISFNGSNGGGNYYLNTYANGGTSAFFDVSVITGSGNETTPTYGSGGASGGSEVINSSSVYTTVYSAGGGAGAYGEVQILNPTAMAYTVGVGGAGGNINQGLGNSPGANGGSGVIIIDEFYY